LTIPTYPNSWSRRTALPVHHSGGERIQPGKTLANLARRIVWRTITVRTDDSVVFARWVQTNPVAVTMPNKSAIAEGWPYSVQLAIRNGGGVNMLFSVHDGKIVTEADAD